ncbi:MAG: hypothetical protein ACFN4D_08145, partial [Cardiobacterium sp.]
MDFAGSIPARSLLRKSCLFWRPPGECRQDYNLSRYLSCHYWSPLYLRRKIMANFNIFSSAKNKTDTRNEAGGRAYA